MDHFIPQQFTSHTVESAPPAAREALATARAKFGRLPAALGLLANSPTALAAFGTFTAAFARSTLSPIEREVVIMTVARENGCELCVAMHSRILRAMKAPAGRIEALHEGTPLDDARLEALRAFTVHALRERGAVPPDALDAFESAGFTGEQALDVIVGIAAYTLSTFANRLTRAPLDGGLERDRPAASAALE